MLRGLYTGWTGMVNEQKRLDVISNNMANADTVGFKDDRVTSQAFDQVLAIKVRDGSGVERQWIFYRKCDRQKWKCAHPLYEKRTVYLDQGWIAGGQ